MDQYIPWLVDSYCHQYHHRCSCKPFSRWKTSPAWPKPDWIQSLTSSFPFRHERIRVRPNIGPCSSSYIRLGEDEEEKDKCIARVREVLTIKSTCKRRGHSCDSFYGKRWINATHTHLPRVSNNPILLIIMFRTSSPSDNGNAMIVSGRTIRGCVPQDTTRIIHQGYGIDRSLDGTA